MKESILIRKGLYLTLNEDMIEKLIREQAYYASIEDYDKCFEIECLLEMLS